MIFIFAGRPHVLSFHASGRHDAHAPAPGRPEGGARAARRPAAVLEVVVIAALGLAAGHCQRAVSFPSSSSFRRALFPRASSRYFSLFARHFGSQEVAIAGGKRYRLMPAAAMRASPRCRWPSFRWRRCRACARGDGMPRSRISRERKPPARSVKEASSRAVPRRRDAIENRCSLYYARSAR